VVDYLEDMNQIRMSESTLCYRAPAGVAPDQMSAEPQMTTSVGGKIWVDKKVIQLWEAAQGYPLAEIVAQFSSAGVNERSIRAGLACLVEAGLLERNDLKEPEILEPTEGEDLVSIILVSFNSKTWLEACFRTIFEQTYPSIEIIMVDNASEDGSADWVKEHAKQAGLIRLSERVSLAKALNLGIKSAHGSYYLLLNPDVELERNAVKELVRKAKHADGNNSTWAAVATKLKLLSAPGFLNGLGNLVGALSWGTDIGLGHLDLGQFDNWSEVPSACFAAALISAKAFEQIGPLDEGFPMYYEDSEWCYRARLLGYQVLTAPRAVILHAFNLQDSDRSTKELTPAKLQRATYGRLRFINRINGPGYYLRFLIIYWLEDRLRCFFYWLRKRRDLTLAINRGWEDFRQDRKKIQIGREEIQALRKLSDHELYQLQQKSPSPNIYKGQPVLTWDVICNDYLPLILDQKTRPVMEFESWLSETDQQQQKNKANFILRSTQIVEDEGFQRLLYRWGKSIQWRLMRP